MERYVITGMSCAACQNRIEKTVAVLPGVDEVSVSLLTNLMRVEGEAAPETVIGAVEAIGYGARVMDAEKKNAGPAGKEDILTDRETPRLKKRLVLSVVFLAALMYITMGFNMGWCPLPAYFTHNHLGLALTQMLLAAAVMIINHRFFTGGLISLFKGAPNMDTLVALGSAVSFGWSVYTLYEMCGFVTRGVPNMELMDMYHNGLYFESAAMIPALITVGKMLEALSKGKTTDALKSLMRLAPKTAVLVKDGKEIRIPAEKVRIGDIFAVRSGESIPVDGVVLSGDGAVNEAALTGEAIPADKGKGDEVKAGTVNQAGFLVCRATKVGEDTALGQIIRMIADASAVKAPIARIADKVSGIFVPAVIALSFATVIGWLWAGEAAGFAVERGIAVLVIACPCALGLATPVAIMVGNGKGAKNGILFKTGEATETVGKAQIIALDKTGTVTSGNPEVTDIVPVKELTEKTLLEKAFALERKSEHPLAKAIVRAAEERGLSAAETSDFRVMPGNGVEGVINGRRMRGGSAKYIGVIIDLPTSALALADKFAEQGKTPLFFEEEGRLLGIIAAADTIRPDSAEGIRQLKNLGLRVVMLTGDNEKTARAIAAAAGIDEWASGMLPDGKEEFIGRLKENGTVAMVGDGINDAPALIKADIGIAVSAGTDVAIDSADIVLMNDRIGDVAAAIRLSRATIANIRENLFWAFFYNAVCIPLAAGILGWKMNPMIAAAAMSLSSVTVCLNALRLNRFNAYDASRDRPVKPPTTADKKVNDRESSRLPQKTVVIEGMMCGHCAAAVKKALEKLSFVKEATVSYETGKAVVIPEGAFDENAVRTAVEDSGYEVSDIKEG